MPEKLYHEEVCPSCGAAVGHAQSCPAYKKMEGITPELEARADTNPNLREEQLMEVDKILA